MFYLITKQGVISGKTKKEVQNNPKVRGHIDYDEMRSVGPDYVINLTDDDLDFIRDKKKLSQIMFQNFFKTDNSVKIFVIINIFLTVLILFFK